MATKADAVACVKRELKQLVGGLIIGVESTRAGYPVVMVKKGNSMFSMTLQSDAEGNDPGFAWVEEVL